MARPRLKTGAAQARGTVPRRPITVNRFGVVDIRHWIYLTYAWAARLTQVFLLASTRYSRSENRLQLRSSNEEISTLGYTPVHARPRESRQCMCTRIGVRARGIPTHYFDNVHCGHTARQERDAYGCHRVSCHRVPPSAYGCLPPSATECHRFAYGPATECLWLPPSLWSCHRVSPSLQTWWNGACHLSSSLV